MFNVLVLHHCFLGVVYGCVLEFNWDYYDTCHVLTYVVERVLVVDYLFGICDMALIALILGFLKVTFVYWLVLNLFKYLFTC